MKSTSSFTVLPLDLLAATETLFLIPVILVTFFLQNHLLRGVLTVKQIIEAEHREHEAKTARLREARHVANAPSQM